jgi:uncharacterized C2H2 Zn-finger protein
VDVFLDPKFHVKKPETKVNKKKMKAKKALGKIPKKRLQGGESCCLCPKVVKMRESLNGHYLHAHFQKEFLEKWMRAKRLSAHSQVRLCPECGKSFTSKEKFMTHLGVTHRQVEPYVQAVENEFKTENEKFKSSVWH